MLLFESLYEMLDSYGGGLFLQNSLIAFCVPSRAAQFYSNEIVKLYRLS